MFAVVIPNRLSALGYALHDDGVGMPITEAIYEKQGVPSKRLTLLRYVFNQIMPPHCILCDRSPCSDPICTACEMDFPALGPACEICAAPIPSGNRCGACITAAPHFDRTFALWAYRPPVDKLVQAFKFRAALYLAPWFAQCLLRASIGHSMTKSSLLLPMPLHRHRIAQRGFNQSLEIARQLNRLCRIPLAAEVSKNLANLPQAELPLKDRMANVRGVFRCDADLKGRSIIVLDDVMTTGATLNELARVLKTAGASHVTNWVLARTPPPNAVIPNTLDSH